MDSGQRLRDLREAAGLSQAKLAELTGVTRNAVSQWEAGETQPSTRRLAKLSKALRVPIDEIMTSPGQTRDRVLNAAERLFDRLGIAEANVDVICATADITRAQFDSMFGSRDRMLQELIRRFNAQAFAELRKSPPRYGSLAARLKYLLRAFYVNDLRNTKLRAAFMAYSWQWNREQERENSIQFYEFHELVISLFNDAASKGQIRHGDFHAASQMIFAAYVQGLRRAIFETYDADQLVQFLEPQLMIVLEGFGFRDIPGFSEADSGG
ncbi:MAG: helix-turn-helix domain-containing protein [Hyphomicrobiaceae bacterium]